MEYFVFFITVPSLELGKRIANELVGSKIAACVNIISGIQSIYSWKGKIVEDSELMLIVKTTETNADALIERVSELHSYETPECIGIKIKKGLKRYLDWIQDTVKG